MIPALFWMVSIFPISFFLYAVSERMIARHESRVGKQVSLWNFVWQTWVDARLDLKNLKPWTTWVLYLFQLSIVFLFSLNVDYLIFIYLALTGFMVVEFGLKNNQVTQRIESDGQQVRFAISSAIAILSLFGCFTLSRTTNMSQVEWSWGHLFFVFPFQLSGMILLGEQPFRGMADKRGWLESARFYAWSMLNTKLLMGGGGYFLDLHLKAAALYLAFRIGGIYFPRFHQKDLFRISILYLFPMTGVLWLFAMLVFVLVESGSHHV